MSLLGKTIKIKVIPPGAWILNSSRLGQIGTVSMETGSAFILTFDDGIRVIYSKENINRGFYQIVSNCKVSYGKF